MNTLKTIFLLFLLPYALSCTDKMEIPSPNPTPPTPPVIEEEGLSYLALGDSYTIGQGVEANLRWPYQLEDALEEDSIIIWNVDFIAQTGWRTDDLIANIEIIQPEPYDIVSLLIGVNDQFQNLPLESFQSGFDSLLEMAKNLTTQPNRVFVVSIPDYGVTPFGSSNAETIAEELDIYNAYMLTKCEENDIPFIDITTTSRNLGSWDQALAEDGLHPSGLQYERWVEEIYPVVREMLD